MAPVEEAGVGEFPVGMKVLVVDDDPTCLAVLKRMLLECRYDATMCSQATRALTMLRENRGGFDVIISDVHMPDMDGFRLLELVGLEMDLPVIMMSADSRTDIVMKGIKHGACDYLIKPVRMEELKNIWQHVVRKKWNENKEHEYSGSLDDTDRNRSTNNDNEYASSVNDGVDGSWKSQKKKRDKEEDDGDLENGDPSSTSKKARVVWSVELHQQFVNAVNHLGIDKAVPKKILELMNVPGLTRENVASHLQKFRLYLKRIAQHHAGIANPFCAPGAPASSAKVALLGGLDFQALAASGQIPPQALGALQDELLGRPTSSLVLPGRDQSSLRLAAVKGNKPHGDVRGASLRSESLPLHFSAPPTRNLSRQGSTASRCKMEGPGKDGNPLKNYRIGKTLGIGSFGKVKIAEHINTGHKVAIKILNRRKIKSMEMEEKVKREIKILRLFMHPHIIRLYEVIDTPADIYMVMEYVKSGELFDYIVEKGRLQEEEARRFFQQIISGVEYCHRNMVVHRDLKPENLLLDSKCDVKIADFGLSNVMRDGHFLKTSCGSPNYAAPEVISGKLYAGPEVDVWSCGVILYALLCGTLPFDDENIPNLFKKIKGGIYTLPSHLSGSARDLIPRMLVVDPMKRITIREIREHPWFEAQLPRYLAVPPPDTAQQVKKIDEETLGKVISLGFNKNLLVESIQNRLQNEATVAYYLILDNRHRTTSGYLGAEYQEAMDSSYSRITPSKTQSSVHGNRQQLYMESPVGLRPHFPAERKWALGLQSRAHPREIMTEVLKALQELNVYWKKIGHYNMKCRWSSGFPGQENMIHNNHNFSAEPIETDILGDKLNLIKFELQLYKTRDEKYLLDLQRVSGPQLLFLDLCAAFLAQLRVL